MSKMQDLTNKKFGLLTVLSLTNKRKYTKNHPVWLCRCKCGKEKELTYVELCSAKSCGCLRKRCLETFGERNKGKSPHCTLPLGESTFRSILACYKKSAKKRGYEFCLTKEEFRQLILQPCFYCGTKHSNLFKDRHREGGNLWYNGLDRINNSIGYIFSNCISCCRVCNRAKDILSQEEFFSWIRDIVRHHELRSS